MKENGLVSVDTAFPSGFEQIQTQWARARARVYGVESMPVRDALASSEFAEPPLLAECQIQMDMERAKRTARRIAERMAGNGKFVSLDTIDDAAAAALAALVIWRNGGEVDGDNAPQIAWRAAIKFIGRDTYGESIPLCSVSDDWLFGAMMPSESRQERAARLFIERAASGRKFRLGHRLQRLPRGRGRRGAVLAKIEQAARLMMDGARMDDAAAAAGFKGAGNACAGDRLVQAVKRLGMVGNGFALARRGRG